MINPTHSLTLGGTGVSGLTRGLATLPQGGSMSLQWSKIGMEDPQEDPLAVHCFCVCSGSVLLGDLLGVSRIWTTLKQIQGTWSSVCSVDLSWIFVCAYLLYIVTFFIFVLLCYNLMDVRCFGLVVSTCAPPFHSAASVLWCWSWEKEGTTVEVVPGT